MKKSEMSGDSVLHNASDGQPADASEELNSTTGSTKSEASISSRDVMFALDETNYHTIVETTSFIDKTMLIKDLFNNTRKETSERMKKVFVTAPSRFGKTTNLEMVKTYLQIVVDRDGRERTNVLYNRKTGKWVESEKLTRNYKLFKKNDLKIYRCQHDPQHRDDECAEGKCEDRVFFYKNCGTHPVIHIDFKGVRCENREELTSSLQDALYWAFRQHEYLQKSGQLDEREKATFTRYYDASSRAFVKLSDQEIITGLQKLSQYLYKHFNGKRAFVLMDELDAPILKLLVQATSDEEKITFKDITRTSGLIGEMILELLKSNDEFVEGALISACFRLGQVFLPLRSDIKICLFLMDPVFAQYYGFTEEEVNDLFAREEFKEINREKADEYYNGYETLWEKAKIYSNYSLIKLCEQWHETKSKAPVEGHWVSRFGMQDLEELMFAHDCIRNRAYNLMAEGKIDITVLSQKATSKDVFKLVRLIREGVLDDVGTDFFFQFLCDYGYLYPVARKGLQVTLKIPDREISEDMGEKLFRASLQKFTGLFSASKIQEFVAAVKALDRTKRETFQELADSVANLYADEKVPEPQGQVELQVPLFTFVLNGLTDVHTRAEIFSQPGGKYRLDHVIVRADDSGIILEIEVNTESALAGLKQIFTSKYYRAFGKFEIIKDKIYIGLHYKSRKVHICAFATDKDTIIDSFDLINENELIQVVGMSKSYK